MSACCLYSRCWPLLWLSEPELAPELQRWRYEPGGQGWTPLQVCFAAVMSAWRGRVLQKKLLLL